MAELMRWVALSTDPEGQICDAGGVENSHATIENVHADGSVMDNKLDVVQLTRER